MSTIFKNFRYSGQTLWEILLGILLYGIVGELIIVIFFRSYLFSVSIGFLVGVLTMAAAMIHIAWSTEYAMDMNNSDAAQKHTMKMYLIRMFGFIVVIIAAYFSRILNMPAVFVGMLALKVGAYLQPFMHRCLVRSHSEANIKS